MKHVKSALLAIGVATASVLALTGCQSSGDGHDHSKHSHGSATAKPYPLDKCIVTDEGFNHGKPYAFVHDGQEIKLCCEDCMADFKKEPAKYLKKLAAK